MILWFGKIVDKNLAIFFEIKDNGTFRDKVGMILEGNVEMSKSYKNCHLLERGGDLIKIIIEFSFLELEWKKMINLKKEEDPW